MKGNLTVDGATIHYETFGEKSHNTLVLLHGGFGSQEDFQTIFKEISQNTFVIAIDSRGHGRSTLGHLSLHLSYERLEQDVLEILKFLKVTRCSFLGFSDGGIVALRIAASSQIKTDRIVTVGTTWSYKNKDHIKEFVKNLSGDEWSQRFPKHYQRYQALNPHPNFHLLTEQIKKMWLDPEHSGHPNQTVANIKDPVLCIWGENDFIVRKEDMDELEKMNPNIKTLCLKNAAHQAFVQQKELFLKYFTPFINGSSL